MMKLKLQNLSTNSNVLHFGDRSVLFSYETPVAVWLRESMHGLSSGYYRTGTKFSKTTTRHINSWTPTGLLKTPWVSLPHEMIETITNGR